MSPNSRDALSAISTITTNNEYLSSTNRALNVAIISGGGGGGAVTIADSADIAEGSTTDAAVTPGSTGTISGKLRQISSDLVSGNQQIQGNIASGSTDVGNPVKIGGRFNTTQPTLSDGQRGDLQLNSRGEAKFVISQNGVSAPVITPGDGGTNTNPGIVSINRGTIFNGTTWDRIYSAVGANGTAGVGIPAAGQMVFDAANSVWRSQVGVTLPFAAFGTSVALSVKATAGNITSIYASNANAAVRYLQLFNKASAPTGGDVPVHSWPITVSGGSILVGTDFFGTNGGYASSGIAIGISTTSATFTAATAADHIINGMYY